MKNCCAKEDAEKRKGSESENFAVNHRYYDALKTIAILRAIDSKTLNLLFVSIRVRSAFLKKALQQNHYRAHGITKCVVGLSLAYAYFAVVSK